MPIAIASLLSRAALATTCPNYAEPEPYEVEGMPDEISGIAASRVRDGVIYGHADAGNSAELHAYEADGTYRGRHPVNGADNGDWEDIAAGPCPDGSACLYIGDIGDNDAARPTISVVVVAEPGADGEELKAIDTWEAEYPDGPHDAETLLVHPCDGAVYVLTKELPVGVYRFPADTGRGVVTLEAVATLDFAFDDVLTGGDWDRHGERLVVRSNGALWEYTTDPTDRDAHWGDDPRRHNEIDEPRGEGVTFGADAAVITASEGLPMPGHVLACAGEVPPESECAFSPLYDPPGCGCAHGAPAGLLPVALAMAAVRPGRRRRPPAPR